MPHFPTGGCLFPLSNPTPTFVCRLLDPPVSNPFPLTSHVLIGCHTSNSESVHVPFQPTSPFYSILARLCVSRWDIVVLHCLPPFSNLLIHPSRSRQTNQPLNHPTWPPKCQFSNIQQRLGHLQPIFPPSPTHSIIVFPDEMSPFSSTPHGILVPLSWLVDKHPLGSDPPYLSNFVPFFSYRVPWWDVVLLYLM